MNIKLGKKQKDILIKMFTGWELGLDRTFHGGWWIQKGGLGYGGDAEHNLTGSIKSLWISKKLITPKDNNFPTQHFRLTKLGELIAQELINLQRLNVKG